jgi:hypothetical protein
MVFFAEEGVMWRIIFVMLCSFVAVFLPAASLVVHAAETAEVKNLRKQVRELQRTVEQLQGTLQTIQQDSVAREEQLQRRIEEAVRKQQNAVLQSRMETPLDQALKESGGTEEKQPVFSREPVVQQSGAANQRLIDISFVPSFFAGSSTEKDETLQTLQGGGHDPHKRGFTLAEGELGLGGVVDPYFRAQAYVSTFIDALSGETGVELEEAYLTTQQLPFGFSNPYGFQLEVGHFFTRFGRINLQHPHQWDWIDQPLINTRLFGADGMRAPGLRASIGVPAPWVSEMASSTFHFGMQNANGETMTSFLGGRQTHGGGAEEERVNEESIGRRPRINRDTKALKDFVYLARWENYWNFGNGLDTNIGSSGVYGPNATGPGGETWIYGLDMKWKWRPLNHFRGWPFLTWQTELMQRDYHADPFTPPHEQNADVITLPGRTLHDWGLYSQLLYGFSYGWAAGVRYEYAGGSGQSLGGRQHDPFRADRHRLSPLFVWQPSEFTRIRLQYNYDHTNHLLPDKNAHSVWLGFQWLYGVHPPHEY